MQNSYKGNARGASGVWDAPAGAHGAVRRRAYAPAGGTNGTSRKIWDISGLSGSLSWRCGTRQRNPRMAVGDVRSGRMSQGSDVSGISRLPTGNEGREGNEGAEGDPGGGGSGARGAKGAADLGLS